MNKLLYNFFKKQQNEQTIQIDYLLKKKLSYDLILIFKMFLFSLLKRKIIFEKCV